MEDMYGTVHSPAGESDFAVESDMAAEVAIAKSFTAFDMVVVTASAGGIPALISFLASLPGCFPAPIVVAQHLPSLKTYSSNLERILQGHTELRVKWAEQGEMPVPGTVYLTPQDQVVHFNSADASIAMKPKSKWGKSKFSGNPLFESAASVFGQRALAIILSGVLFDGAQGAQEIARLGGRVLAQSFGSCQFADMPRAAMKQCGIGLAFDPRGLAHAAMALVMAPGASGWFRVGAGRARDLQLDHPCTAA